jgi:hypothetical protein
VQTELRNVQSTGTPGEHVPAEQTSPTVHGSPSSHVTPSGTGISTHASDATSQTEVWQSSDGGQTVGVPDPQTPS